MRRAARAASVGLVLLLATAVLATLLLIYRPHPVLDGDLRTLGMHERGEILRDRYGVPHIFARNAHDLFYMQGYVLAQDRLFQMDLYRRAAHGRLSEVLGSATLEADKLTRTLSLTRGAERDLALLSDEARAAAEDFAAGINKYLEQHGESLPLEFLLLGYRPEPWASLDSLAILKLQAYDQAVNFETELLRARVAQRLGISAVPALFPEPQGSPPLDAAWARISPYLGSADAGSEAARPAGPSGADQLKVILGDAGPGAGSNCWALAGSRTASGKPLLAGDPHLGVRNPSIWYELALEGAGYRVAGFTIPGVPGVILGHNDRIAWSLTVAFVDQQDLFLERADPAAPAGAHRYLYGSSAEDATVHRETILVKGRESVPFEVVVTRHGPIITPVVEGVTASLALRWTALDGGRNLDGILALDRARDWNSFRAATEMVEGPALTLCYADVDGHIGYALAGQVAERASAEDGRLPLPGWTGSNEWRGRGPATPLSQAPRAVLDPPDGLVVIANQRWNDLTGAGSQAEWDPGFRGSRARTVLQRASSVTVEDLRRLQTDVTAADPAKLLNHMKEASGATAAGTLGPQATKALGLVNDWDGQLTADSAGAAVYEAFNYHALRLLLEEKLGSVLFRAYMADARPVSALRLLIDGSGRADWRDTRHLHPHLAHDALTAVAEELSARLGSFEPDWRWGALHRITFAHPLGSAIPLGLLNIGPFERGGDDDTINDAPYDPAKPYDVRTHASLRTIVDLGDIDASWSVLPTGQSGQAGSPHWGDQTQLWLRGELKPMPLSRDRLDAPHRLVLRAR